MWGQEEFFLTGDCQNDSASGFFERCNDFELKSTGEQFITLIYYSFTSLTTVGFGDYHPKSDVERLFIAASLLFGVAIFSLSMGIFIDVLGKFKELGEGLDDGDELQKFFAILRHMKLNIKIL